MKLDRFINRPVLSTVISILIVILGILGLLSLPITQYPDIAPPTVSVKATYTGANAQTVLNSVIAPLEDQINGVENMMYMTSSASNNGSAEISIYFKQGTDPDMAAVNVQNRVSMAQGLLPAEVTQIGVTTQKRQNSMLIVFSVYDAEDRYDQRFIENYAKINLIPEVQRVPGVGDANVLGTDYSMRIWLKPDVMAQYKLVPNDVAGVLAEQNVEAAPGSFGERGNQSFQYTIRYKGRLQEVSEFENMVVKALPDGEVLRMKDIADIELGRLTYNFVNKVNGHSAVTCIVYQMAGTNATETINNIQNLLEETEKILPPGLKIDVGMNANDFLYASIHEVLKTLIEAFILVFIVVYIFLQDLRSTLIPAIAIPVALIGTFFMLSLIGFSLNLLTLCAMVLAIAIVVDDAIVVVEGVHAKLDQGYTSARLASIDAMNEISGAIISITLVMSAVFVPVGFMSGTVGIFYRQFSLTLAVAIVISGVNALTLSPALCALMLKPVSHDKKVKKSLLARFFDGFNKRYDHLERRYKINLRLFLNRRFLTYASLIIFCLATWGMTFVLPSGFIPNEDQGMIYVNVDAPPGATLERSEAALSKVQAALLPLEEVETVSTLAGYSLMTETEGASFGMGMINLKPWNEREQTAEELMRVYADRVSHIKDADIQFFLPPTVPGFGNASGFELRLQDKTAGTFAELDEVAKSFVAKLNADPRLSGVTSGFNPNFPQYLLRVDLAKAAKLGIDVNESMETLQSYVGSFYSSNFVRFGQMYKVMLQAAPEYRMNPEDLFGLYAKNKEGNMVPYSNFMTMERVYGPSQITRYNLFTSAMITGEQAPGVSSGEALEAVEEIAAEVLPRGYDIEWSGVAREEKESGGQSLVIFAICLVFVYLLLAAQYESLLLPLPVILSLPAGVFGSFLLLYAVGLENNIYAQVALVMLIGLLGKNAILIIEVANQCRKEGVSIMGAAIQGATSRLRPILMTSFAFISGLIPLAVASGAGALGNRSIGTAAAGGMLIGTFVGIFLIPGLYVIFESLATYLKEKKQKANEEEYEF